MNTLMIKKAIKGDEKYFVALIEKRQEKIYRIAYSYVKNQHDALDIVQETVYKAYVSIHKLKKPEYFDTWLVRIAINCSIDYLKKENKYVTLEEKHEGTKEYTNQLDESIDLYLALDKLEPKYKTVIILKYFEDLTFTDIAKILDYPVSTVKNYLYRALKYLKISIEEGELDE